MYEIIIDKQICLIFFSIIAAAKMEARNHSKNGAYPKSHTSRKYNRIKRMTIGLLFSLGLIVLMVVSAWKTYEKANQPGWACIIPIYSTIVMLEIIGKPWWWLLLLIFLPGLNIIWAIWMLNLLSKSFGKGTGFTLGLIFLPFIFYPILGLGDVEYQGPAGLK